MPTGGRVVQPHVATSVADESVDSDSYVDGSIDLVHMSAESVDSDQYVDGSIDTAHLAADAVDGTKIADDAIDSEHYTDNSVDAAHLFDLARGSVLIGNASAATAELTVGSDNYVLTVDGSGDIGWEAAAGGGISTTLADGNILVGNDSNVATSVNPSGDIDVTNAGVFSIASGAVVNADVGGSAAIDYSKLAALSSGNILVGNGSNVAVSVNPSGDVDVTNAGVFSIASGVVVDADVNASAAISISKTALVAGTNITLSTNTLAVDDAFIKNDASDTTTGTITAAGFTTTGHITLSDDTPADDAGTGIVVTMTALDGLVLGELVHIDGNGKIDQADANVVADMPAIGIALTANDTGSDAEVSVLLLGLYNDTGQFNFTPGAAIYASTTAGDFTETAPSSDGDLIQRVGVAVTADILYFNPSFDLIEHA